MKKYIFLFFAYILSIHYAGAKITLPNLMSDNMLIQRDKPIEVRGWADKNEKISVIFNGQTQNTKADKSGKWQVAFKPMPFGGPYEMTIRGKENTVVVKNILIGDLWVCSGQSNMELSVAHVKNSDEEIQNANYQNIRSFQVRRTLSATPKEDLIGEWTICSPETVGRYTAVGYFFARKLHEKTGIPIGIVNASWGGTNIEGWINEDAYNKLPARFIKEKEKDLADIVESNMINQSKYEYALNHDPGMEEEWFNPTTDISSWGTHDVPKVWSGELKNVDGNVWFRYDLNLKKEDLGKKAILHLGMIDNNDITWVNGIRIGRTWGIGVNRNYEIKKGLLREGKNTIVIQVNDYGNDGGIYGDANGVYLQLGNNKYDMTGSWKYKIGVSNLQFNNYRTLLHNEYPSLLYNGMLSPIMQRSQIKGVIWYQGENNVSNADDYRTLFPQLINGWREQQGEEFPFYWVQLANYMKKDEIPNESTWAKVREAQTLTLSLPHTGQAVITDIGEENDIHPRNKQDVGLRLARIALNKDYEFKDIVCSSPTFQSMKMEGSNVIISFDNIASGLIVKNKYGYIEGFAIAGADHKFYFAKAHLTGDKVVVSCDKVKNPVAVRYSWANNPDVNLYNSAGLPATPFRTDNWDGK